ncbi:hypothetical protein KFE25_000418 [Diacronema lutheri]|uniref:Uncharacterized protein n=2 Tax=Diacronema lutheri TaxID=2081491 RepID=A0A8J5XRK5_DIALT|nr:hypothetical protein KFE25_000418 [Diacronema lutheri]
MLARCATQEAQTDASPAQERVEMLRGLCAQAGLDVSGVVDEAQLLARIAAHPPALDALRARIRRNEGEPASASAAGDAPDDDEIEIIDLDDEEEGDNDGGYSQSTFGRSASRAEEVSDRTGAAPDGRADAADDPGAGAEALEDDEAQAAAHARAQAWAEEQREAEAARATAEAGAEAARRAAAREIPSTSRADAQRADPALLRALDSAIARMFIVADTDDDLRLSARELVDGIAKYGQVLLSVHRCTLPAGTALTMADLARGVRTLIDACDTDGDGLISLPEAQADGCRAALLAFVTPLNCQGESPRAAVNAVAGPLAALLRAQGRLAGRALGAWSAVARGIVGSAAASIEATSPLGRLLIARLRAVRWEVALPRLRTYALWLSVGVAFALCGSSAPSGDEPYPRFEVGPGAQGADAAGADWVDDE